MSDNPLTHGVHHAGLTVPDLAGARAFFVDGLGFEQVGEKPDYPAVFVSDGSVMVTLWQARADAVPFDRHGNIGLHHLAFRIADVAAVHELVKGWPDAEIEFEPERLGGGQTRHMMCAIPGGIRVEFIQPAA